MTAGLRACLLLVLVTIAPWFAAGAAGASPPPIQVNQFGYAPGDAKWVAVPGAAATFQVRRLIDDQVVISGNLALRRSGDPASGDNVYSGTFSSLAAPGEYYVHVPGKGDSAPFHVHEAVYDDLFRRLLKGLYYQRCGTAITAGFGGAWTHGLCHTNGASAASYDWTTTGGTPGGFRNTGGGWHDAGDYGKYSTNNAVAVGTLLQAYEEYPARYAYDDCAIPESGNGIPDLLDEARWSLEWMLRMQLVNGSVLHRESVATYGGEFIPENDPQTRYHTSISSDATAVHAAAMALAARVYLPFDPGFAAACSTSAVSAWNWLLANPNRVPAGGFANLHGHSGATYIAGSEVRRRMWAAAELFRLNGNTAARNYFDAHWGDGLESNGVWYPDGWGDTANLAAFTYRGAPGATASKISGSWWSIENSTLSSANTWNNRLNQDGYGCAAATGGASGDYYWGFTGVILRYAWTLLEAHRFGGSSTYIEGAREQLHYVLGRNPVGKVFITGIGENPVRHAHGGWNFAAGYTHVDDALCRPVPYLLVGGTNAADNGSISPYMGRCYEDIADPAYFNKGNYTLNETAVNIQAALIVLAGYFGTGGQVTGVPEAPLPPVAQRIRAWPNPFSTGATIEWLAPEAGRRLAEADRGLSIYDIAGRRVARLTAGRSADNRLETFWNGRDETGASVPPGVYFLKPAAGGAPARLVRAAGAPR